MVVLDLTVMNIALPSAQRRACTSPPADRQWVVTAYTLAFGSLLLPGGKLVDLLGQKVDVPGRADRLSQVFRSSVAPRSTSARWWPREPGRARFAALLVPSALSLLTTTFKPAEGAWQGILASSARSPPSGKRGGALLLGRARSPNTFPGGGRST